MSWENEKLFGFLKHIDSTSKEEKEMAMKSTFYVEYAGNQVEDKAIIAQAKAIWAQQGNKMKDLTSLNLYVKPEENAVYYVFNDEISGQFPLV